MGTPTDSTSALSIHYHSSELSETEDPFFGVDFLAIEDGSSQTSICLEDPRQSAPRLPETNYFPPTPDKTPSILWTAPPAPSTCGGVLDSSRPPDGISQSGLSGTPRSLLLTSHLGTLQDPQWRSPQETSGDNEQKFTAPPSPGSWVLDPTAHRSGLDPNCRDTIELPSVNELAAMRKIGETEYEVQKWIEETAVVPGDLGFLHTTQVMVPSDIAVDTLPQGEINIEASITKNDPKPGQTYFVGKGGELTEADLLLIRQNRNWEDAPLPFEIIQDRYQPETSQAAIEKFGKMCRDTDSVVSLAMTWGTRRRSHPSIIDDHEAIGGNFLKKLTVSKKDHRRPSLLEGLRALIRKPGISSSKRPPEDDFGATGGPATFENTIAPYKKRAIPSINAAFTSMGEGPAVVGGISNTSVQGMLADDLSTLVPSVKSSFGSKLAAKYSVADMFRKTYSRAPKNQTPNALGVGRTAPLSNLAPNTPDSKHGDGAGAEDRHQVEEDCTDTIKAEIGVLAETAIALKGILKDADRSAETNKVSSSSTRARGTSQAHVPSPTEPRFAKEVTLSSDVAESMPPQVTTETGVKTPKGSVPSTPNSSLGDTVGYSGGFVGEDGRREALEDGSTPQQQTQIAATNPPNPPSFLQIGTGRIRIELVSMSRQYMVTRQRPGGDSGDSSSLSSDSSNDDSDGGPEFTGGIPSHTNNPSDADGCSHRAPAMPGPGSGSSSSIGNTGSQAIPPRRSQSENNGEGNEKEGEDGNGRKRRRVNPKPLGSSRTQMRFACPYQVYEPSSQKCFRRGPRNPEGGCSGIIRLRQHLARRHMASYRCSQCWVSFDSRRKVVAHEQQGGCLAKQKPDYERFMDPLHEGQVEGTCNAKSEEDVWWSLFRLLIPGMDSEDEVSLKSRFYPYYVNLDVPFMIPALTFSDMSFEPVIQQEPPWDDNGPVTNSTEMDPNIRLTSPSLLMPSPALFSHISQSIPVPIYEVNSYPIAGTPGSGSLVTPFPVCSDSQRPGPPALSVSEFSMPVSRGHSTFPPSSQSGPSSTPNAIPDMISDNTSGIQSSSGQATGVASTLLLQRTNERLRQRVSQANAEVEELRQGSRANLQRANIILDEVLEMDLASEVYEKLLGLSEVLAGMVRRCAEV